MSFMMATSSKTQSTKAASNWEDADTVDAAEKQTSKVKILSRSSQDKKDEPELEQLFKPVSDATSVVLVSTEEQHRTQYVPEAKVLIMKRPTQDGLGNAANNKPKHPVKTLEQRQAEYKEARLRILGIAEPEEKKVGGGAASNSDDNPSPDAGTPALESGGSSSVAQGAQRGLITGPAARLQQQQSKKQAAPNGRQNNQGKRNVNNQQTSSPSQPLAPFANSQFNPCAPPFQHSSMTNGNGNSLHQSVVVSQQQVFSPTQPPPMSAAPPTVMMAQQFSQQYPPGQQYHQPGMGSHPAYPHGMPPPPPAQQHSPQFVAPNDMTTVAYMQQQGANVYQHHHHQQQQEQQYMAQQQFFNPHLAHFQQMQHSIQYMQIAPPMPQQQHNHQPAMTPQAQHIHQLPMQQQQHPPPMLPHQTFPPPRPQYVQRPLGPRTTFPPPPTREEGELLTNGGSSNCLAAPIPPQQQPVAADPTPREKSPTADSSNNNNTTAAPATTAPATITNGKGNKKTNKNKAAKGKAYSTTRNSYTIKQRPKENDSVSWRVKPAEIIPEQDDSTSQQERSSDLSRENTANVIETLPKNDSASTQDRSESPEGNDSASPKNEDNETPKDEGETGSSSPITVVKAKKKTKRGKKKNATATALTVAISTTTVARSNCKFDNERIVRMPYGPDGSKGFNFVR